MKKIFNFMLGISLCGQIVCAQSAVRNPASEMWNDPQFVKSFTASYGVLFGFEPEISDLEKEKLRGLLRVIQSDPRAAIEALESQISDQSSAAFDFILANLYFQGGHLDRAEQSYRNCVHKFPNFRRAHKNLGQVLVQKSDYQAAIPVISKALELGDVDGRSYGLLGFCYLKEQLYYPAEAAYRQAILLQPSVRDWRRGLASCLLGMQDFTAAIAFLDTLIKQEPDNVDYWLLQSRAYIGKDALLAASRNLEVVRRMGAGTVESQTLLGDIYMSSDLPELALSAYLEVLQESGNTNPQALVRAAKLFTQRGELNESARLITQMRLQHGATLSDEDDLALLTLEAMIARAEGDDVKAFASLTEIVERDALNGEALIELGDYYASQHDLARAVNRYEQAQLIGQFERKALVAHGLALVGAKNYQKALVLLNRAQNLKTHPYLAEYIERIERAAR